MQQTSSNSFPFKVWLLTILVSPLLLMIAMCIYNSTKFNEMAQSLPFLLVIILVSAVFSLPALFLFRLLYKVLHHALISVWSKKIILSLVGSIFIWVTFYILDGNIFAGRSFNDLAWPFAYTITLSFFTFLLSFQTRSETE